MLIQILNVVVAIMLIAMSIAFMRVVKQRDAWRSKSEWLEKRVKEVRDEERNDFKKYYEKGYGAEDGCVIPLLKHNIYEYNEWMMPYLKESIIFRAEKNQNITFYETDKDARPHALNQKLDEAYKRIIELEAKTGKYAKGGVIKEKK